ATPIPRTLAQSLYGDLEVLTLKEKPAGRLPVKTRIVPAAKVGEMLSFLKAEATKNGNQVYWVVPRIFADATPPSSGSQSLPEGGRNLPAGGEEREEMAAIENAVKRLNSAGDW